MAGAELELIDELVTALKASESAIASVLADRVAAKKAEESRKFPREFKTTRINAHIATLTPALETVRAALAKAGVQ